jgi:(2Fe-2S) ferredoxin
MQKEDFMAIPEHIILVCQSFRANGDPKGICHKQTSGFLQYIEEEILDRGLDCQIVATGCLKQCENGPIMVVQPDNWWFKGVDSEDAIDAILDGLEDGEPCQEYLL